MKVNSDARKMYDHEKEIRQYIEQAWAEAVHLYKEGKLQPFARKEVLAQILEMQELAMEDDWRQGAIAQYLEDQKKATNSTTCVIELWHRALNEPEESKPSRKDSIEITQILANIPGWVQGTGKITTAWGRQKFFRKDNYAAIWR